MNQSHSNSLAGINAFSDLAAAEIEHLGSRCTWQRYEADQQILDRDSETNDVYFVVEGAVRVVNYSLGGREIQFGIVEAGDFFGELAAIDGLPRSANVTAASETVTAVMGANDFLQALKRTPNSHFM